MTSTEKIKRIDGSYGEGGGQILRSSLALASLLRQPIEIFNIRKGRPKPGLAPQHLTAVSASRRITSADLEGAQLESLSLKFTPKAVTPGDYYFDVAELRRSAGSTSLVFQTLLLPLSLTSKASTLFLKGGTHVPFSPLFDYLDKVFLPTLRGLGIRCKSEIRKWGYYPAGGGEVFFEIEPASGIEPIDIKEPGRLRGISILSAVSNLPDHIAQRQAKAAADFLKKKMRLNPAMETKRTLSSREGTYVFILAEFEKVLAGFSSLGQKGKPAEKVALEACQEFKEYWDTKSAFEPHLADQLILYLAFGRGDTRFTVSKVTQHLLTNAWVVRQFLPAKIEIKGRIGEKGEVEIRGSDITRRLQEPNFQHRDK
jgi:RNA 3'-phosphate cyclase